jgi:hypothetical protein
MTDEWACEAYGDDGADVGARCFVSGALGVRSCESRQVCAGVMADERRRVYRRMQELAATGDPVMVDLAAEFTRPDQLLNADGD